MFADKTGPDFATVIREHTIRWESVQRFAVPFDLTAVPVTENFLGRQDELDNLWQYLQPKSSQSRKVAILLGLGGIGKTQLAIRFARHHKHDFTAIFWLSGNDRGTLLQCLSSILPRLPGQSQNEAINDEEVEQRARHVLRWLATEGNSRWLIIFDNIEQYSLVKSAAGDAYDIGEFFPAADHGSILITTRLQNLTELGKSFPVNRLDSDDAIKLLLQSSRVSAKNTISGSESNPDTLALARRLGGLPLAIVIAGAFMRETGTSTTEYLQYYQESWSDLQLQSNLERQYEHNMLQTWMISYREIQKRDPQAADLLLFLAHFDNRDIWYELIKSSHHSSNVPVWLEKTISSGLAFKSVVRTLIGFSLLETKEQDGGYAMHPVVQYWCIHLANADRSVDLTQLDQLALISVGYTVPSSSDRNYSRLQQRLIPHANYVRYRDWPDDNIDTAVWGAFDALGNLYSDQGKPKEAEEMYRRALAGYEKALGPDHTSTLNTVNNIGLLYKDQGNLQVAEQMYQRALVGYEKALGPDHTSTLDTINNLGLLYKDQGNLQVAEQMYQRALAGYEKALGPDHTSTLMTVNNLGLLYKDQGNLRVAEQIYQRALAGYEKALGPDHTSTLMIVNNLGLLYKDEGNLQEAEQMYQRALAGYEKALGPDYTSTLMTINLLGSLYKDQGKLQEAEEMYQRALVLHNKLYPPGFRDFEDLGDSDVSLENDSVFSAPISLPSTRSLESGGGEINSLLIQEFATLLHENAILPSLILVGVSKQQIGFERMRNNFRRLLKDFANNLKAEIHSELHRELRSFVSSYSDLITRKLFAMSPIAEKPNVKHSLALIKKRPFHERKVEDYLEKLHRGLHASRSEEFDILSNVKESHEGMETFDPDEESDQGSVVEEAGEDEPYEGSLQHLDQMKHFVLESAAYRILLRRLEEFVQPSLYSRLRDLVTRWSFPESKNHDDVARYKLRNLVTELQHVDPHEIRFDCDQDSSPFVKFISHYQHTLERWTGERWDWWPLPRFLRPLGGSETRLRWRCVSIHLLTALHYIQALIGDTGMW
ncbi:hypothetical protein BJX68DRAFT_65137 [Aspergillus pseudodeflectus]|uniref:NB-ARC domain-containing protein n=1 Tax=Aspergillus pseudodeflectus TaxID=176178 RepID=A0ABR4KHD3_9EURO